MITTLFPAILVLLLACSSDGNAVQDAGALADAAKESPDGGALPANNMAFRVISFVDPQQFSVTHTEEGEGEDFVYCDFDEATGELFVWAHSEIPFRTLRFETVVEFSDSVRFAASTASLFQYTELNGTEFARDFDIGSSEETTIAIQGNYKSGTSSLDIEINLFNAERLYTSVTPAPAMNSVIIQTSAELDKINCNDNF